MIRLRQLFALAAILLMIAAAYVLRPPNEGTLRKANVLNLASMGKITEPFFQWSNAYAFQLIAGDGTPAKLGLGLVLIGGVMLGLSLNLGKRSTISPRLLEGGSGDEVENSPLSTQWGGVGGGDSAALSRVGVGSRVGKIRLLIGLVCLALLTERNGNLLDIALVQKLNIHAQAALLFFGLLMTASALIGNPGYWKTSGLWSIFTFPKLGKHRRTEILAVSAITTLALIIRSWRLGSAIHGPIDEMHFINAITLLWQYPNDIRILQPFSNIPAFPWVFPYAQWGGVEIFGNTLTGIRVLSVLIGTATIPALYLLARSLFDKTTALAAALILATFPPHIHFSRAGINNIADPLMGTAALAFLAYGLRTRQRWAFVLAGIMLGLTQYFYDGGRLLYPTLTLLWLVLNGPISRLSAPRRQMETGSGGADELSDAAPRPMFGEELEVGSTEDTPPLAKHWETELGGEGQSAEVGAGDSAPHPMFGEGLGVGSTEDTQSPLSTQWGGVGGGDVLPLRRGILLLIIAFVLIAAPIYYTRYGQDSGFSSRSQDVRAGNDFWRTVLIGDSGELIYLRHLSYTFLIYIYMPEMSWFYGGHTPLILHVFVPLFLLGLFWSFWNWRRTGPLLLILWVILVSLGNSLLSESATSARYVVIFPALALLMAIGLRQAVALLFSERWPKHAQTATISLIVVAIALTQTGYYFDRHIEAFNNGRLSFDADDAMFRAADLPLHTHVHIINEVKAQQFNAETLKRFLDRTDLVVDILPPEWLTDVYMENLPRDVDHAFFLPPNRYDLLARITLYFELDPPQYSPYNVPREFQFALYFAAASKNSAYPDQELWSRRVPPE